MRLPTKGSYYVYRNLGTILRLQALRDDTMFVGTQGLYYFYRFLETILRLQVLRHYTTFIGTQGLYYVYRYLGIILLLQVIRDYPTFIDTQCALNISLFFNAKTNIALWSQDSIENNSRVKLRFTDLKHSDWPENIEWPIRVLQTSVGQFYAGKL